VCVSELGNQLNELCICERDTQLYICAEFVREFVREFVSEFVSELMSELGNEL